MERIGALLPIGTGDQSHHKGARRRSRRFPLNAVVTVVDPVEAAGVAINASAGGIRIFVDREVPAQAICTLRVQFTSDRCSCEQARVVWCRSVRDGWVIGLEFLDVTWSIPPSSGELRAA